MTCITSCRGAKRWATAAFALALVSASGTAAAQQFTMKVSSPTIRTPNETWAETLKKNIEARTNGRVAVSSYPGSQIASLFRLPEAVQLGTVEIGQTPPEFLTGIDERFSIFSAPAIFRDQAHCYRTISDPELRSNIWEIGRDKGILLVGHICPAPSDYLTRQPVRKVDDLRGLKLRVFASPIDREVMNRLGATGVPMPLDEVLPALQRRAIDGNKTGITVLVPFKFYDTAKFVLKAKESMITLVRIMSATWHAKLPDDIKAVLKDEFEKHEAVNQRAHEDLVRAMYAAWEKNGGTVTELPPEEQNALYRRLETVGDEALKDKPKALELSRFMKRVAARHVGS